MGFADNGPGAVEHMRVKIQIDARMDPLACSPTLSTLGQAGTNTVHRDFPGAPLANTWYPQALANALAGADLSLAASDASATFNSSIDGGGWVRFQNVYRLRRYNASP